MNYLESIDLESVIKWRNHLHAHPELSFQEFETSQYIEDVLTSLGGLTITRPTVTSVLAVLDTQKPGKTIALRADMDALPMQEEADVEYTSTKEGRMHSCGHDTHVAMLLGATKTLLEKRDELTGKVVFIFQHGEEVLPGGAKELVEAGVLEGVDEIYGLHVVGSYPVGFVGSRKGVLTAAVDTFELSLSGIGSHGSSPELSIDLIVVGSEIVNALQTIVSRSIPALEQGVVTVGQFNIGTAANIIADKGFISGTVRTVNPEIRVLIEQRIKSIVQHICDMHGAKVDLNYILGYASVENTEAEFKVASQAVIEVVGQGFHELPNPFMGSEDFSAYTNVIPGCFMMIGGGNEPTYTYYNHHPKFKIMDEALQIGAAIHVQIIMDLLSKKTL